MRYARLKYLTVMLVLVAIVCILGQAISHLSGLLEQDMDILLDKEWTETIGTVTDTEAVVIQQWNGKRIVSYDRFSVHYAYDVDGQTYTGVFIHDGSVNEGASVKLWYDANDPIASKDVKVLKGSHQDAVTAERQDESQSPDTVIINNGTVNIQAESNACYDGSTTVNNNN